MTTTTPSPFHPATRFTAVNQPRPASLGRWATTTKTTTRTTTTRSPATSVALQQTHHTTTTTRSMNAPAAVQP